MLMRGVGAGAGAGAESFSARIRGVCKEGGGTRGGRNVGKGKGGI